MKLTDFNFEFANCEITDDEGHPFIHDMFLMGSLENIEKVINYFDEDDVMVFNNTKGFSS